VQIVANLKEKDIFVGELQGFEKQNITSVYFGFLFV